MKSLLIDIYKANDPFSGLGQFSNNFANEIIRQNIRDYEISFLTPKGYQIDSEKIQQLQVNLLRRYFPTYNSGFDIWHSLYQFPSFLPDKKTKQILTIHDLNFLIEKRHGTKKGYLARLQKNVDRADVVTTISHYSKKLIEENLELRNREVHVIHNGVYLKSFADPKRPRYCDERKFFFSLGVFKPKKNFHVLLPILDRFKDHTLIIAGNNETAYGAEIRELVKRSNLVDRVILPGKISDEDKFYLYKNCEAFLFPSLAEGFGMPLIEAMNIGKPIFISDHCSLPEIAGNHAFYFSSFEKEDMVSVIENSMADYSKNAAERAESMKEYAEQFSWENCIKGYLEIYNKIDR